MKRFLFTLIIFTLLLAGCSGGSSKPSDVSQEIWDNTMQYTIIIKDSFDSGVPAIETSISDYVRDFRDEQYKDELTESEEELIENLIELNISWLELEIRNTGAKRKSFENNYDKLVETFGEDNLDIDNLDLNLIGIEDENELYQPVEQASSSSGATVEDLKKERGVNLTNLDVQYDMVNNLEKEFAIVGTAELSDYYNYGFTNEEKFFVAQVTPNNGSYSDSWYLYFNRDSFPDLYEALRAGNQTIGATAIIPENTYKSGQGNMAVVHFAGIIE